MVKYTVQNKLWYTRVCKPGLNAIGSSLGFNFVNFCLLSARLAVFSVRRGNLRCIKKLFDKLIVQPKRIKLGFRPEHLTSKVIFRLKMHRYKYIIVGLIRHHSKNDACIARLHYFSYQLQYILL